MPRPIISTLAVALLGMCLGTASAATLDDKADPATDGTATSETAALPTAALSSVAPSSGETANKKKGSRGSKGSQARSPKGGKGSHRSGPAQHMTRPGGMGVATGTRTSAQRSSASSAQRSSASSAQRSSASSAQRSSANRSSSAPHKQAHQDARTANHTRKAETSRHTTPGHNSGATHHVSPQAHHTAQVHRTQAHRTQAHKTRTRRVHHSRYAPQRWVPGYHRTHMRGVPHYSPRYWAAGVFYYNPPPRRQKVVVVESRGGKNHKVDGKPTRAVNRNGDFGVSMTAGSYMSGYQGGGGYGDMGLGLSLEYRPVEAVGLELSWMHHSETWEDTTERLNTPLQLSANLYAFPWTRVSPYITAGLTWDKRSIQDEYYDGFQTQVASADDTLFGPHAGLGIEFALGDHAALNFEANYVGYLNRDDADLTGPSALQGTMGLGVYF